MKMIFRQLKMATCLLFFSFSALAQQQPDNSNRIVKSTKKVFVCTFSHYETPNLPDTFKTAAEACQHWASAHLPAGYKFVSVGNLENNGSTQCICKKGNEVNDQAGQIMGKVICPELATEINEDIPFKNKKCECPDKLSPPYYIAVFDKCELDTCSQVESMQPDQLLAWATARLNQITMEENDSFAKNTARVYDEKVVGQDSLFSYKEVEYFGNKFGWKKTPAGPDKYSDAAWAVIYGHAIERLVSVRVEKEMCLKKVLQYIKNVDQTKDGGQADFKGKLGISGANFDITTPEQATKKQATPEKKDWIFITYNRLIVLDENGNNKPAPPRPNNNKPSLPIKQTTK